MLGKEQIKTNLKNRTPDYNLGTVNGKKGEMSNCQGLRVKTGMVYCVIKLIFNKYIRINFRIEKIHNVTTIFVKVYNVAIWLHYKLSSLQCNQKFIM